MELLTQLSALYDVLNTKVPVVFDDIAPLATQPVVVRSRCCPYSFRFEWTNMLVQLKLFDVMVPHPQVLHASCHNV
jgi:hypothetical protein